MHGEGPLTSDARPSLEYAAERALIAGTADPARHLIADLCEPPLALVDGGSDGRDLELERTLARRAEANRAFSSHLSDIHEHEKDPDELARIERSFALATTFADDVEMKAALLQSLFFPVRQALAQISVAGGKYPPELIAYVRRVIAIDPEHPESLKFAALLAQNEGKRDEALAPLDRYAKAAEPWRTLPQVDRSMLLWNVGRTREAYDALKKATSDSPSFVTAWKTLEAVARAMGDGATAEQAHLRVLTLESDR